ncbi:NAD(P)-binding protein [Aureobasidium pullulans]|nr:NAD(P)-binding protein [Aureobasidium pullulans]
MPEIPNRAQTEDSTSFSPDAYFEAWEKGEITAPYDNDFRKFILSTFGLPHDDTYTYAAVAEVSLLQAQTYVEFGGQGGLHAWYRDDEGKPRPPPPAVDIAAYTNLFKSTTATQKALVGLASNAKKDSIRASVGQHLQALYQPPSPDRKIVISKLKKEHTNPYFDVWAWSCQNLEWAGPEDATSKVRFSHAILPILYHHFGCVCPSYESLSIIYQLAKGRTVVDLGSGNGYRVLDGKVAVVTGASRGMLVKNPNRDTTEQECTGIGAATCENLASKGCSLIMNYTSDSSESITVELAERLSKEHGIKALPVQADMGTENGPAHLIATALNHFAHPKTRKLQIDIIINNAGVASNRAIEKCDVEDFDFVYRVNVRGPLFLMKAAIPYLPTDRSGRIVNVSSVSASCGFSEQSVYGGSKAAVEAMTRTWARELAERCTVNAINPGPVLTDMWSGVSKEFQEGIAPWLKNTPLAAVRPGVDSEDLVKGAEVAGGRPAYESETAGVIAMLCTPDAAYTTGSVISCNGGFKFSV